MRLLLAIWTLFGVIGFVCMLANAHDVSPHSHHEHTVLILSSKQAAAVPVVLFAATTAEQTPVPAPPPRLSAVLFARGPEVLRSLARIMLIAVQFWRA
jgi:hypothetical protein